ncbi:MAG: hypothetical protein IIC82_06475 [Chloroflexi bacterium]|nr:hypothetical protein [Chloroflexota bacterium]
MDRLQKTLVFPTAIVTAALALILGYSFGSTLIGYVIGDSEGMALWELIVYLGLLGVHTGLFSYAHVRVVRQLMGTKPHQADEAVAKVRRAASRPQAIAAK